MLKQQWARRTCHRYHSHNPGSASFAVATSTASTATSVFSHRFARTLSRTPSVAIGICKLIQESGTPTSHHHPASLSASSQFEPRTPLHQVSLSSSCTPPASGARSVSTSGLTPETMSQPALSKQVLRSLARSQLSARIQFSTDCNYQQNRQLSKVDRSRSAQRICHQCWLQGSTTANWAPQYPGNQRRVRSDSRFSDCSQQCFFLLLGVQSNQSTFQLLRWSCLQKRIFRHILQRPHQQRRISWLHPLGSSQTQFAFVFGPQLQPWPRFRFRNPTARQCCWLHLLLHRVRSHYKVCLLEMLRQERLRRLLRRKLSCRNISLHFQGWRSRLQKMFSQTQPGSERRWKRLCLRSWLWRQGWRVCWTSCNICACCIIIFLIFLIFNNQLTNCSFHSKLSTCHNHNHNYNYNNSNYHYSGRAY